jgi:hypothetical protein
MGPRDTPSTQLPNWFSPMSKVIPQGHFDVRSKVAIAAPTSDGKTGYRLPSLRKLGLFHTQPIEVAIGCEQHFAVEDWTCVGMSRVRRLMAASVAIEPYPLASPDACRYR